MDSTFAPFQALKDNLEDMVLEEQAKLGYRRETIRLYYPLSSLRHLLKNDLDAEEMDALLEHFADEQEPDCGPIGFSRRGDRFCIILPERFSELVHEKSDPKAFIVQLAALLGQHGVTMEQVEMLFAAQKADYERKPVKDGEFDELFRFTRGTDRYFYCFKKEGPHMTYHRFLPEDYADLYGTEQEMAKR